MPDCQAEKMEVKFFSCVTILKIITAAHNIPQKPLYFDQIVDHFATASENQLTFKQRYYMVDTYFKGKFKKNNAINLIVSGPGSPIFAILVTLFLMIFFGFYIL